MQALRGVGSDELRWVKPRGSKLNFELRAGEAFVATLVWTRGSRALGQWADGQYQFSREGWFRPRVVVRGPTAAATEEPAATFAFRGGTLTLSDGRILLWKKPQRWTNERVWVDGAASVLVRFRPATGHATAVVTSPSAVALPELPMLILLGQYLLVLATQDAVAASTAAMVAVMGSS